MIALLSALALVPPAAAAEREPVAWALAVEGRVLRSDGTYLDPGEALEPGADLTLPVGAVVTVAHGGRIERWTGPAAVKIGNKAVRLDLSGQIVSSAHVEGGETSLTGDTQAPAERAQRTSALGVPLTADAWARQDAIDNGVLHALYRDQLAGRLAAAGVDPASVAAVGLLDGLPGDRGEQVALVGGYLDLAAATPHAAVVFEVPPTALPDPATGGGAGAFTRGLLAKKPRTLRAGADIDKIRVYGFSVAQSLRRRGHAVFGLVVPYANTVDNVVARHGQPADGVENLHSLLVRAGGRDGPVTTVAFGYSQGAAVVRDYVGRYGDSDGLDYALPVAVMGGVDGEGADGVWSGRLGKVRGDGVSVLSIVHAADPARGVWGPNALQLLPGLYNFAQGGRPRHQDLALHAAWHGSPTTPLPPGADADAALAVGLHGYPTAYLAPLVDDLFAGRDDLPWARRGDWAWDSRIELTGVAKGDFTTWRHDPRAVADGYAVPTAAAAP